MQKLLTGKVRFKEFNEEWVEKRVGDVIQHKGGKSLEKFVNLDGKYKFISIGTIQKMENILIMVKEQIQMNLQKIKF